MIEAYGHRFTPFGDEEMMCRPCGYVIWPVTDEAGAIDAIHTISREQVHCGGEWHKVVRKPLASIGERS